MKEIQEIIIENFQSHLKTIVKPALSGNLTVLTGQSDSGKTAILRALRWVFYNSPNNTDFIRVGSKFAKVTVTFSDGMTVVRWRSNGGINRYVVNGEVLEGFGTGVPLEVIEVTGVKELTIGDLHFNLNLAEQLDGPFLGKSVSAPARAKVLGKLAGTEEIDYAGKMLGTDLYRRNHDEKRLGAELQSIEASLIQYDYLPSLQEKIIRLEEIVTKVKLLQEKRDKLMKLKNRLQYYDVGIVSFQQIIKQFQDIESVEFMAVKTESNNAKQEQLLKNKIKLSALNDGIIQAQIIIESTKNVETTEILLVSVNNNATQKHTLIKLQEKIKDLNFAIYDAQKILARIPNLERVATLLNKTGNMATVKIKLAEKIGLLATFDNRIDWNKKHLIELKKVKQAENILISATEKMEKSELLAQLSLKKSIHEFEVKQSREKLVLFEQQVSESEGAYKDELISIGQCPVCGQEVNPEKLKEVV